MPTNITLSIHEIINPLRKLLVLDGTSAMSEIWNQQEGQTELTERNINVNVLVAWLQITVLKTRQLDIRSPDT